MCYNLYFLSNFDVDFFELILTRASDNIIFQWISSISYDFQVKSF
jgi:hypothetical protein